MQEKFIVNDISCQKCASKIISTIGSLDGVSEVKVNLEQKEVVIESTLSWDLLRETLLDLGYEDIA